MNSNNANGNKGFRVFFTAPSGNVNYINELSIKVYDHDEFSSLIRNYQYLSNVENIISLLEATRTFIAATGPSHEENRLDNESFVENLGVTLPLLVTEMKSAIQNSTMDATVIAYCQEAIDKRLQELKTQDSQSNLRGKNSLHDICYDKLKELIPREGAYFKAENKLR